MKLVKLVLIAMIVTCANSLPINAVSYDFHDNNGMGFNKTGNGTCRLVIINSLVASQTTITVPSSVQDYENYGVYTVTSIAPNVFDECSKLETLNIPNTVTSMPVELRNCTKLQAINVAAGNPSYSSINGVLFNKDKTSLLKFPVGSALTNYAIPNTVTTIEASAFWCCSLKSVVVPGSVTTISTSAFSNCANLESIELPNSIRTIGNLAFVHCSELKNVVLPKYITTISNQTFYGCSKLSSIIIPSRVTSINYQAFYGCTNLKTIYNYSNLTFTQGSTDNGYVAYYATSIHTPSAYLYDGNSTRDPVLDIEEGKNVSTSANALIYYYSEEAQEGVNVVNGSNNMATDIQLTDAQPFYCPTNVTANQVSYTRNFTSTAWQALYLPFEIQYEDWADKAKVAYINDVHQYDEDDDGVPERTMLEFFTVKSGSLKPNTPYMIKPLRTGEETFTVSNATLTATPLTDGYVDCSSTSRCYTIAGTYQTKTDMYDKGYYTLADDTFRQAEDESVTLSPFRIYLDIKDRSGNGAMNKIREVQIIVDGVVVDDIETGVNNINTYDDKSAVLYDLQGRRAKSATSGILICDGKKVFIK